MVFVATVVMSVEFVGGKVGKGVVNNYAKHLEEELKKAAQELSLRTVQGSSVVDVMVTSTN